ncbi:hypothetical protein [Candidatus Phytoplasma tritici]|uniref:hypothetical protein n=1 Tax=Candidatus Phytoplasma tritici TaxID=321961 RepID=UPI0003F6F1A5|nr:hypothetical protein [Candidatus Phytoplasma tritici]
MKFIGKKILCLALILNLVIFFIFIVFNVCSFSFFKNKNSYFNNNFVYAQKEESANEGNNKNQNDAKDNQLNKPKEENQEGWGSWLWNITKAAGSSIYNKLAETKTPKNIDTQLLNQIQEEITAIENTKEQIKELTQQNEILKNILESDEAYQKAEQQYKEVENNLKENKFQDVSNLLKPSKSWWQSFKSFFPFLDNQTPQPLKEAYKTALDNLQKVQQVKEDLDKLQNPEDKQEKPSLWASIQDKINNFWPSANADVAPSSLNIDPQEEISTIRNFFNNHKFATKLLGLCLGEKSNDVSLIASNLTRILAKYLGNEAKKEVTKEFADVKRTFPEKLKQGVKDNIFEVITAAVAFTSLVVAFLYWFIVKKIKKHQIKKPQLSKKVALNTTNEK